MKTPSSSSLFAACIATIAIFVVAFSARPARAPAERDRLRDGPIDARRLERIEALGRLLLPDGGRLEISTERMKVYTRYETVEHRYTVTCRDPQSGRTVYMNWDVDREMLRSVSQTKPQSGAVRKELGRRELVSLAGQWLRVVGIAAQAASWRLDEASKSGSRAWFIQWRAADRIATVMIDDQTGDLIWAQTYLRPHS